MLFATIVYTYFTNNTCTYAYFYRVFYTGHCSNLKSVAHKRWLFAQVLELSSKTRYKRIAIFQEIWLSG